MFHRPGGYTQRVGNGRRCGDSLYIFVKSFILNDGLDNIIGLSVAYYLAGIFNHNGTKYPKENVLLKGNRLC